MILLDDFFREAAVNGANVFSQCTAWFCLDLLDFFQSAAGDKQTSCLGVMRQHLAELSDDVFQNVRWSIVKQRFQRW